MEIREQIRRYVVESIMMGSDHPPADDASLLESGILDSTGVLELVAYLQDKFGVTVADEEMIPENLDSVAAIATFVAGKTAGQTAGKAARGGAGGAG